MFLPPGSFSDLSFHSMLFKISFSMTWLSWQSRSTIFQTRKDNQLTDLKFIMSFVGLFSFLNNQKQWCPQDRTFSKTHRLRGQGQGLELQGQGFQKAKCHQRLHLCLTVLPTVDIKNISKEYFCKYLVRAFVLFTIVSIQRFFVFVCF